jgi:hypothetical protein
VSGIPTAFVSADSPPAGERLQTTCLACAGFRGRVNDRSVHKGFTGFGRYAGPATLILSSLAEGPEHGYALTKDIDLFADVRLAPGTLYEALSRLEGQSGLRRDDLPDDKRPWWSRLRLSDTVQT